METGLIVCDFLEKYLGAIIIGSMTAITLWILLLSTYHIVNKERLIRKIFNNAEGLTKKEKEKASRYRLSDFLYGQLMLNEEKRIMELKLLGRDLLRDFEYIKSRRIENE